MEKSQGKLVIVVVYAQLDTWAKTARFQLAA